LVGEPCAFAIETHYCSSVNTVIFFSLRHTPLSHLCARRDLNIKTVHFTAQ